MSHQVRPDDGVQALREPQRVGEGDGEVGALVGADGQARAVRAQPIERLGHTRIGKALLGDAAAIDLDEAGDHGVQRLVVQMPAGGGEGALDQGAHAIADHPLAILEGDRVHPVAGQHRVDRAHEVLGRVHQGAVQIEGDHRALQTHALAPCGSRRTADAILLTMTP